MTFHAWYGLGRTEHFYLACKPALHYDGNHMLFVHRGKPTIVMRPSYTAPLILSIVAV